ncbi:MAG TPA: type II secretion system F family protein [Arthrobacter sp.]
MTGTQAAATVCGIVLGVGLWLILVRLPMMRATTLAERIEPQLKSQNLESRLLLAGGSRNVTPFGPLERIMRPMIRDGVTALGRLNLGSKGLARRLAQAGIHKSITDFRAEQLLWGAAGFSASLALVVLGAVGGRFSPLLAVVAVLGGAFGGFLFRDYWLGVQIRNREARMMAEFPSLAELMALAVGAGESATGALDRVCRSARGELAKEFSRILAETRAGKPLVEALQEFSARTDLGPLVRFVDGIIVAVERGTPLADVLRAQAQDVRDTAKRDLMESAGRKEIGMMVPLVFGVLPLTVVFAVYPGIAAISLGL